MSTAPLLPIDATVPARPAGAALPAPREADVLALLRARHTQRGNGGNGEYAFLTHVRDRAGFDARRTIDAVAVSLWPSRGLVIDGFEVKVSRSDWLRELAKPEKAEDTCKVVDRFWVVAPEGVVHANEDLPPMWGYLVVVGGKLDRATGAVTGRKLRVVRQAELLHGDRNTRSRPVSRDFLAGILRAVGTTVCPTPESEAERVERERALAGGRDEYNRGRAEERAIADEMIRQLQRRIAAMRDAQQAFQSASGVPLADSFGLDAAVRPERFEAVGRALRAVLDGDDLAKAAEYRLAGMVEEIRRLADQLDQGRKVRVW